MAQSTPENLSFQPIPPFNFPVPLRKKILEDIITRRVTLSFLGSSLKFQGILFNNVFVDL